MRGLPLIFLSLIPAFIALGHDTYLFYENFLNPGVFSIDLLMKEFKFSALGFIWTTYDVESYKTAVQSMAPEDWAVVDYILTFKAFYVGLGFSALIVFIAVALGVFGIGPFAGGEKIIHGKNSSKIKSKRR